MGRKAKREEKRVRVIWIAFALASGILSIVFTVLFLVKLHPKPSFDLDIDPSILGQYGDLIGGLVGTFLGGISAFLIYMTYRSQKAELKATQDALYDQKDETAIFNMLSTLRDIINDMKGEITTSNARGSRLKELTGRQYFHEATNFVREKFSYVNLDVKLMYNPSTHKLHEFREERTKVLNEHGNEGVRKIPHEKAFADVDNTINEITEGFEREFNTFQHNFDHYLRYVRNIVEFIETIKVPEYKELYIKIFRAQLSLDEKVMIFYYALSVKDDIMFHYYVDSFGILSDINQRKLLFDNWHYLHYPLTDFRFLSEKELKEKNEYQKWKSKSMKKKSRHKAILDGAS